MPRTPDSTISANTVRRAGARGSAVSPTARRRPAHPGERPVASRGILPGTFVHLYGIGAKTERRLWQAGVCDWETLSRTGLAHRHNLTETLHRSREALDGGDLDYFFTRLPAGERWRAFADFGPDFVALDIETTGLSIYDHVTVIGTEYRSEYRTFIRGSNLEEAADYLADAKGLITFNGALFDLPFIQRALPSLKLPEAHVDLRFLARRVELAGPLKTVEHLAELDRGEDLADISGYEATVLWSEYEYDGSRSSLSELVSYNAADACVLRPLAELVVDRLYDQLDRSLQQPAGEERLFELAALDRLPRRRRPPAARVSPPAVKAGTRWLKVGTRTLPMPVRGATEPAIRIEDLSARITEPGCRIVGIDLTGAEARPTGWALMQDGLTVTGTLASTREIIDRTLQCRPRLVSIDSPLSLPDGRDCTDDGCACRAAGITRHCERVLKRRGVNVYPCLIQSMQALTRRGMEIADALRAAGVEVIESYPGAAQDIMRIPRKRASQLQLRNGLERFGVRGLREAGELTHDELDAATSAVVGMFYLAGLHEALGNETEGHLIIPALPDADATLPDADATGREPRGVCMLLGAGASAHADALGLPAVAAGEPVQPGALLVGEDLEDYWRAFAAHGPALRAATIEEPGHRMLRRPRFVDLQLRAGDPVCLRELRRWIVLWGG